MTTEWFERTQQMPPGLPPLGIVVAVSRNGCIGVDGKLPWHLPEDLAHFKNVTTGHAVIMGRRTYDSIGRPLPNRRNLVVSRNPRLALVGCEVTGDLESAIVLARETDPMPMVIGGAAIYEAALPLATKIHLTRVHRDVDGDAFFPELDASEWEQMDLRPSKDGSCDFITLERR